jgi:hypothetical protein
VQRVGWTKQRHICTFNEYTPSDQGYPNSSPRDPKAKASGLDPLKLSEKSCHLLHKAWWWWHVNESTTKIEQLTLSKFSVWKAKARALVLIWAFTCVHRQTSPRMVQTYLMFKSRKFLRNDNHMHILAWPTQNLKAKERRARVGDLVLAAITIKCAWWRNLFHSCLLTQWHC